MAHKRLHAIIRGRVQGVFFRACTEETAHQLGLTGWVRNLPDGGVEVVAEGEEDPLNRLQTWLHRGPPGARVDGVQADWSESRGRYRGFQVVYYPPE